MSADQKNPDDEVLCHCSGTRRGQIRELFLGGRDMDGISRWTGALSGCGGCEWDIGVYLEELSEAQATEAAASASVATEVAASCGGSAKDDVASQCGESSSSNS